MSIYSNDKTTERPYQTWIIKNEGIFAVKCYDVHFGFLFIFCIKLYGIIWQRIKALSSIDISSWELHTIYWCLKNKSDDHENLSRVSELSPSFHLLLMLQVHSWTCLEPDFELSLRAKKRKQNQKSLDIIATTSPNVVLRFSKMWEDTSPKQREGFLGYRNCNANSGVTSQRQ